MARRSCVKFLKLTIRECQDDVNFTLKPLFKGNRFRKPVNKGLQKVNAHKNENSNTIKKYLTEIHIMTYVSCHTTYNFIHASKKELHPEEFIALKA